MARLNSLYKQINTSDDDWVKRLQVAIGAIADNEAGPETLSKCPVLLYGSQGAIVKLLQERLGDTWKIGVEGGYDGSFGKGTKAAVIEFQHQNGLTEDGIVGRETWKKLLGL